MARQFSSLTQPLSTHYANYNQTVTYVGDLDNLSAGITDDSDLVQAINFVYNNAGLDSAQVALIVDSAETALQSNIDSNAGDIVALGLEIDSNHSDIVTLNNLVDSISTNFVTLATNQTITGEKTFGSEVTVDYASPRFTLDDPSGNDSSTNDGRIQIVSNGSDAALFGFLNTTQGQLSIRNYLDGATRIRTSNLNEIRFEDSDGNNTYSTIDRKALKLPTNTSANRPGSVEFGQIRGNTTTNRYEVYDSVNSQWSNIIYGDSLEDGFVSSLDSDGTFSSGTYTPSPVGGNFKAVDWAGSFTLAAPTHGGNYNLTIHFHNTGAADSVTRSGFDGWVGSELNPAADDVMVYITKNNGRVIGSAQEF